MPSTVMSIWLLHFELHPQEDGLYNDPRLLTWFSTKPTREDLAKFGVPEKAEEWRDNDSFFHFHVDSNIFFLESVEEGQVSQLADIFDALPKTKKNDMLRRIRMLEGSNLNSPYQEEELRVLKETVKGMVS